MTPSKRIFDVVFATILVVILLPILLILSILILLVDGRPVFFISERMKTRHVSFQLYKFRTMRIAKVDAGVSGGNKLNRITKTGSLLRKYRLDEIPQLLNIFKGDMSFIGPRPPLRIYVERFPEIYDEVLKSCPGVSGLASIVFHKHETNILSKCNTALETDRAYTTRCIPTKAKLDLIYQRNATFCYDCMLVLKTIYKVLR
ncbi:sugar transferase [Planktomarina temperata]|nr:sugar transferase [Planktomarina temperata]